MKKLGLIGGISWVSTSDYYKLINEGVNAKLGGLNFAECIIYSFNYADIKKNNDNDDWDATLNMILKAAECLKLSGAEAIILCANTMHLIADKLQLQIDIPIIHIAEVTAREIKKDEIKKIGLLGTKFTMERDFFRNKLSDQGIKSVIPAAADRDFIQETIYYELGKGIIKEETKQRYISIINNLIKQGAEGIILGCTEIPLIIKQNDVSVKVFDTTLIHSAAAVEFILSY
ncbi:aspartate/glutamate racemase family protein [Solitalea canadensis]|uniref:Aspartate racemase n=1 Tax=Solitalea canadensis (strain ATCC 29591 / DSM 3403 / JCM 21819 / LMG 8368 / NBRC 15130 / NCIMB 12057 / USAM 9D) TaxID=929556 RepID=H8KN59_SOLCM|nr:aspartate/glutamate racemase family protein [Solitalea canadensis]AFD09392.1 aspartate racemase [Solitalea canadensis DSM 3403]